MKKNMDCQVFEDQLDTLVDGHLPEEGARQLQLHALSCPDCAMLLRVQEHVKLPPLEELEAEVPDHLLASLWPNVAAATSLPTPDVSAETSPIPKSLRRTPWMIPTLAAASVALLLSTGFLFSQLRKSEGRVQQLSQQVGEYQQWLALQDGGSDLVHRTAELAGGRRNRARALDHALAGKENITIGTLIDLLERYPESMVLFDTSQIEGLSRRTSRPHPELRGILAVLGDAFDTLGDSEGVRVGEFTEWLASSRLPMDMALPKSPLMDLLS